MLELCNVLLPCTFIPPSPCIELQRGLQQLSSLLRGARQLLGAEEVACGAHLQHCDHGWVGVQPRGQLGAKLGGETEVRAFSRTRIRRQDSQWQVLTFTLATRVPRTFFIQEIRSSACSCVRRSDAAEQETKEESHKHKRVAWLLRLFQQGLREGSRPGLLSSNFSSLK